MALLINGLLIFAAGAVVVVVAIEPLFQPVPLIAGPVTRAAAAGCGSMPSRPSAAEPR